MNELLELLKQFTQEYIEAPLYGGYSRTLKRKIPAKSQVQAAFIDNIILIQKLSDDPKVITRVTNILKSFE